MAMTTAEATIIAAATSIAVGGTLAAPVTAGNGASVGPFVDYSNTFAYRIKNGAGAPTAELTIVFFGVVGTRLYEIGRVSGDKIANSEFNGAVPCPPGFSYFTAKAFGNVTNAVVAEVYLERQVP